ncbi:ABC transporter permease subunit [Actinoplanes philippinensis]|uniref:ABC transporter permease subunit n=1 Tax=Actinoplanes philippinensis TaxID=35752 RepID=UPI0033C1F182
MSLARAETRRLFRRRFTSVILISVLLILAATAVGSFFSTEKVGETQIAAAKAEAQQNYQEAVKTVAADKQRCLTENPTNPAACEWPDPSPSDYDYTWYMPETFNLRSEYPTMITLLAVVLAGAAFLIGASFVGSEWNSGGMMNLLLWRPRRLQVLGTKLTVLLGWFTGLTLLLGALWTGIFTFIATSRGTTEKMTGGVWQSFGLTGLRGLALVVVAGAVGFAMASLGRHTGMALGALVGLGALQIGVYIMAQLAGAKYPEAWLAPMWAYAWMFKEYEVFDYNSCNFSGDSGCEPDKFVLTWQMTGVSLAVITVLIVGASLWAMRRRDIT